MTERPAGAPVLRRLVIPLLVFLCALAPACTPAPTRPHASLSGSVEPLQSQFNQDSGRVRVVMIAAPT